VDRQRIDKWLWHARVVRRRSAAAGLADAGLVRINGVRVAAASATVRIGDVVTIALDRRVRVLKVGDIAARRSASASAEALYVELASMACDGQEPPSLAKAPSMG
jgi:ribosome-associated heat shock protein Hsp15